MKICINCKSETKNDSRYCPVCGGQRFTLVHGPYFWVVVILGCVGIIALFVTVGIMDDLKRARENEQARTAKTNATPTLPSTTPNNSQPMASEEDQLKAIVSSVLNGKTNVSEEDRLLNIDVVKQISGGWGVFVQFNADENLTDKLTKKGIEMKMSDVYIALYTSNKDVRTASTAAYLQLVDKYGNKKDVMVYKSILDSNVARKVNWSADKSSLKLEILPGVWSTTILSMALKN